MELEKKTSELIEIDRSLAERTRDLDRLLEEEAYLKVNQEGTKKSLREIEEAILKSDSIFWNAYCQNQWLLNQIISIICLRLQLSIDQN